MSNDEKNIDEGSSDTLELVEPAADEVLDDDAAAEGVLADIEPVLADVSDDASDDGDDKDASDTESDTEALDDLEAEELEMLTEDEASETIIVDEETQLRDIRRAQISIEAGSAGGVTAGEFVCSDCFLVKKTSQMSNRRKKICLDCAI